MALVPAAAGVPLSGRVAAANVSPSTVSEARTNPTCKSDGEGLVDRDAMEKQPHSLRGPQAIAARAVVAFRIISVFIRTCSIELCDFIRAACSQVTHAQDAHNHINNQYYWPISYSPDAQRSNETMGNRVDKVDLKAYLSTGINTWLWSSSAPGESQYLHEC